MLHVAHRFWSASSVTLDLWRWLRVSLFAAGASLLPGTSRCASSALCCGISASAFWLRAGAAWKTHWFWFDAPHAAQRLLWHQRRSLPPRYAFLPPAKRATFTPLAQTVRAARETPAPEEKNAASGSCFILHYLSACIPHPHYRARHNTMLLHCLCHCAPVYMHMKITGFCLCTLPYLYVKDLLSSPAALCSGSATCHSPHTLCGHSSLLKPLLPVIALWFYCLFPSIHYTCAGIFTLGSLPAHFVRVNALAVSGIALCQLTTLLLLRFSLVALRFALSARALVLTPSLRCCRFSPYASVMCEGAKSLCTSFAYRTSPRLLSSHLRLLGFLRCYLFSAPYSRAAPCHRAMRSTRFTPTPASRSYGISHSARGGTAASGVLRFYPGQPFTTSHARRIYSSITACLAPCCIFLQAG
jgi:hypothetical protein